MWWSQIATGASRLSHRLPLWPQSGGVPRQSELAGMFARLAPDVSLADELVADRRAEVRAEEQADEAERRRRGRS